MHELLDVIRLLLVGELRRWMGVRDAGSGAGRLGSRAGGLEGRNSGKFGGRNRRWGPARRTHPLPASFLLERHLDSLEEPPLQLVPARGNLNFPDPAGHLLLYPLGLGPGANAVAPCRERAVLIAVAHLDQTSEPTGMDVRVELDGLHDLRRHDPSCPEQWTLLRSLRKPSRKIPAVRSFSLTIFPEVSDRSRTPPGRVGSEGCHGHGGGGVE